MKLDFLSIQVISLSSRRGLCRIGNKVSLFKIIVSTLLLFTVNTYSQTLKDTVKSPGMHSNAQDTSLAKAFSNSLDTSKTKKKIPPVKFVKNEYMSSNSVILKDSSFLWSNYRYSADILRTLPGGFLNSLGSMGQPEELILYGQNSPNIGMYSNGITLNNSGFNHYDLNRLQTESLESIELLPLPRSFFYGAENNTTALFLTPAFRVANAPYTRISFYQAANGEGAVDAQFYQQVYRKLNLAVVIANRKLDFGFANTAYSSWMGKFRLTYPVSDSLSVGAEYAYDKSIRRLWGGVNIDSVYKVNSTGVADPLYDPIFAPPVFWNNYSITQSNSFSLFCNSLIFDGKPGSINLFYKDYLDQIRLNEKSSTSVGRFTPNYSNHILGVNVNQKLLKSNPQLDFYSGIEFDRSTGLDSLTENAKSKHFVGLNASLQLLDTTLTYSVFTKYLGKYFKDNSGSGTSLGYNGIGTDLSFVYSKNINFYFGLSFYKQSFMDNSNLISSLELKANASYNNLNYGITIFKTVPKKTITQSTFLWQSPALVPAQMEISPKNVSGINLNLTTRFGFLQLESSLNIIKEANKQSLEQSQPLFQGSAGLYYKAIHFDSALHIKTGFNTSFYTSFHPRAYDYLYLHNYPSTTVETLPASMTIDFVAIGEIQKSAIVYFMWENLFDTKYFTVPYYPAKGRGIRFGLTWDLFN